MSRVFKRGEMWCVDLSVDKRRVRKAVSTSKKLALLVLKDMEVRTARKKFAFNVPEGDLAKLFKAYIEHVRINTRPSTSLRYQNVIDNFHIFLAARHPNINSVDQLTPATIEEFIDFRLTVDPRTLKLSDKIAPEIRRNRMTAGEVTINYEIKTLRSIFRFGIQRSFCLTNPCDGVRRTHNSNHKIPRFLTREECALFLENCEEQFYPVFLMLLYTGVRLGEILHLEWRDIDLGRGTVRICAKNDWLPKTGEREIPLNRGLKKVLTAKKRRGVSEQERVFHYSNPNSFGRFLRKQVVRTADRAGIQGLTQVKTFRHTFASHLVMSGVDLPTVARLLGHTDIKTTMIYSHLAPVHLAGAVQKLDFS